MRTAWILASGTELTLGQSVDTNSGWIAQQLAALGVRCTRVMLAPDDLDAVRSAIVQAAGSADVVVMTGGLGPTDDDLTRAALALATGEELVLDPASLEQIRAWFARRNREMPERNQSQALRPASSTALENAQGTAPGILAQVAGRPVFALPGVPAEMRAMFATHVAPRVSAATGGRVLLSRRIGTHGLPEAEVGQRLADLMARGRDPEVGTTASSGIISVRINASGATHAAALAGLDETERIVRDRLGLAVFGRDEETLASAVGRLLVAAGQTLATAESCTGGLIGKLVTDVPGSSRYYLGGVVAYDNVVKTGLLGVPVALLEEFGAVSEPVAGAMARRVRELLGADWALGATGIAGPDGGTLEKPVGVVYVSLSGPRGERVRELRLGDAPREWVRLRTSYVALDQLRRGLSGE